VIVSQKRVKLDVVPPPTGIWWAAFLNKILIVAGKTE
jgi:hypothetical protein